jgi:hypothetical protein
MNISLRCRDGPGGDGRSIDCNAARFASQKKKNRNKIRTMSAARILALTHPSFILASESFAEAERIARAGLLAESGFVSRLSPEQNCLTLLPGSGQPPAA